MCYTIGYILPRIQRSYLLGSRTARETCIFFGTFVGYFTRSCVWNSALFMTGLVDNLGCKWHKHMIVTYNSRYQNRGSTLSSHSMRGNEVSKRILIFRAIIFNLTVPVISQEYSNSTLRTQTISSWPTCITKIIKIWTLSRLCASCVSASETETRKSTTDGNAARKQYVFMLLYLATKLWLSDALRARLC